MFELADMRTRNRRRPCRQLDDVTAMDYAGSQRCMQASTNQFGDSFTHADIPILGIGLMGKNVIIDKKSGSHYENIAIRDVNL